MKTFTVYMSKGGVGKTTITSMLAFEMGKKAKTLIIDGDQQGNLTSLMLENFVDIYKGDFLSLLKEEKSFKDVVLSCREETDSYKGLYIIGTLKNDNNLKSYLEGGFRDNPYVIKSILKEAEENGFEYVFIDLPPSLGFYEKIIIANSNEIIPVIEPEDFAVESLSNFNQMMKKIKIQFEGKFEESKFLFLNKENKEKKVHQFWIETIKSSPYEVYEFIDSRAISSATAMHVTLQEYNDKNKICEIITDVCKKLA